MRYEIKTNFLKAMIKFHDNIYLEYEKESEVYLHQTDNSKVANRKGSENEDIFQSYK